MRLGDAWSRFPQPQAASVDFHRQHPRQHCEGRHTVAARIVVYSQFDQDELIREAYRIGCAGFVVKHKPTAVLADAIRTVRDGRTFFLDESAQRLALISVQGGDSPLSRLLPQELEVFKRMALGLTNVEIAEDLKVSPKTISNRSQTVKDKLGIHRAAEITRLAVRQGVIEP